MSRSRTGTLLLVCLVLFTARVVGQALVALGMAPWLPPMERWQSGLLPYPVLLTSQLLLIAVMAWLVWGVYRARLFLRRPYRILSSMLQVMAILYGSVMVIRFGFYVVAQLRGETFLGGCIPIFFHWVLAGFLGTVGEFAGADEPGDGRTNGSAST